VGLIEKLVVRDLRALQVAILDNQAEFARLVSGNSELQESCYIFLVDQLIETFSLDPGLACSVFQGLLEGNTATQHFLHSARKWENV
jgi:hypothetical protein